MQYVRNLLNEQRRRAVGSLMKYLEDTIYDRLTPHEQQELRRRVLGVFGQYHDICLDMVKASVSDGTMHNEEALPLLHRLSADVQGLRRDLNGHR